MLEKVFNEIVKELNTKLNITPVLYGSFGLGRALEKNLDPKDIDLLVPKKYLEEKWSVFKQVVELMGFRLKDLREHEFERRGVSIGFSYEEDLMPFAGVGFDDLKVVSELDAHFKVLSLEDYLACYEKSSKDGYRKETRMKNDQEKISLIKQKVNE